jgi:hypothetical protein
MTGWMLNSVPVAVAEAEVPVPLQRHADQAGDRVLLLLGQVGRLIGRNLGRQVRCRGLGVQTSRGRRGEQDRENRGTRHGYPAVI